MHISAVHAEFFPQKALDARRVEHGSRTNDPLSRKSGQLKCISGQYVHRVRHDEQDCIPVYSGQLFQNALQDGTISPEQSLPSLAGALVRSGRENNQSAVRKVGVAACVYPAGPPKRCTVRNVSGFALRSVHVRIKQ